MSPAAEFARLDNDRTPREAAIAAVFIAVAVGLTFTAFDLIASGYLRRVIIHSVKQHAEKVAEMWEMSARHVFAGTIVREIGGVTSGIVGGLDLLKTGGLTPAQQDVLVRKGGGLALCLGPACAFGRMRAPQISVFLLTARGPRHTPSFSTGHDQRQRRRPARPGASPSTHSHALMRSRAACCEAQSALPHRDGCSPLLQVEDASDTHAKAADSRTLKIKITDAVDIRHATRRCATHATAPVLDSLSCAAPPVPGKPC